MSAQKIIKVSFGIVNIVMLILGSAIFLFSTLVLVNYRVHNYSLRLLQIGFCSLNWLKSWIQLVLFLNVARVKKLINFTAQLNVVDGLEKTPNKDQVCVGRHQKGSCKGKLEEYGLQFEGISIICLVLEAIAFAGACAIKKQFVPNLLVE